MESISLDSNGSLLGIDCGASLRSLLSLVSSDETNVSRESGLPPCHAISSAQYHTPFQSPMVRRHRRASSRRSINTEMAIIASSSPEIKALVLPIAMALPRDNSESESESESRCESDSNTRSEESFSSANDRPTSTAPLSDGVNNEAPGIPSPVPSMIYCRSDPSENALSPFPLDGNTKCEKIAIGFRLVSPTDVGDIHRVQENSYDWFAEEHRDQDDCFSTNSYYQGEERDVSTHGSGNCVDVGADEIDELALYMERHCVRSITPLPTSDEYDDSYRAAAGNKNFSTPLNTCDPAPKTTLMHTGYSGMRKSGRHRRVSYDCLPEISEILFPSDSKSIVDLHHSTGNVGLACSSSLPSSAAEMQSIAF